MSTSTTVCHRCRKVCVGNGFTTGYGLDRNGHKFCFACCGVKDQDSMVSDGRATLYLSNRKVTNWPGSLVFDAYHIATGRHNIAGKRYDAYFNGPDGHVWHGVTFGDNTEICHCKRTKQVWDSQLAGVA